MGLSKLAAAALAAGAAKGNFGAGTVLQVVQTTFNGTVSTSSATLADSGLALSITPSSVTSKILAMFSIPVVGGSNDSVQGRVALLRDATRIFDVPSIFMVSVQYPTVVGLVIAESILDAPATASPVNYKVQVARNGYAGSYGGSLAFGNQGGTSVAACQLTLMEIAG